MGQITLWKPPLRDVSADPHTSAWLPVCMDACLLTHPKPFSRLVVARARPKWAQNTYPTGCRSVHKFVTRFRPNVDPPLGSEDTFTPVRDDWRATTPPKGLELLSNRRSGWPTQSSTTFGKMCLRTRFRPLCGSPNGPASMRFWTLWSWTGARAGLRRRSKAAGGCLMLERDRSPFWDRSC